MEDNILERLEQRVDELLRRFNVLSSENSSLRQKQFTLVQERKRLIEKNALVRGRVEEMIERLKKMEGDT